MTDNEPNNIFNNQPYVNNIGNSAGYVDIRNPPKKPNGNQAYNLKPDSDKADSPYNFAHDENEVVF